MLVFAQPMELPRDRIVQVIQIIVAQAFIVTHTVSGTKSVRSHLPKKMNAKQVKIDRSSSTTTAQDDMYLNFSAIKPKLNLNRTRINSRFSKDNLCQHARKGLRLSSIIL